MWRAGRAWLVLSCTLLCACAPQRFDSSFLTMGTTAQITLIADDATQAQQASRTIEQRWSTQARDWHAFGTAQGELRRLNAALAGAHPFQVSAELLALLRISQQATHASQGFFDPAVAPMTEAWGFDDADAPASTPTAEQQHSWLHQPPSITDLHMAGNRLTRSRTDLQLDLGGIAKGQALDVAAQIVRAHRLQNAVLNLGGQVLLLGTAAQLTQPIAIRAPRANSPLAFISLQDGESMATSGDYERYHLIDQRTGDNATNTSPTRITHILDPHTGVPVKHTQAVTVIAHSGAWADAASTALMAAGPDHWQAVARNMGIREALRMDASGEVQVTAAMYARLRWSKTRPAHLTIIALPPP